MNDRSQRGSEPGPGTLSRRVRIGGGLLSGVGATGTAAGLGLVGTSVDLAIPFVDPSGLLLLAPVIAIPFAAGAVLRGRAAIVATATGAVAAPMAAAFAIDQSCEAGAWIGLGLLFSAILAGAIAGVGAFVGDRVGGRPWFERNRTRVLPILIAFGLLGLAGWIAFAARATPCS
jgi:hypothetical protein